MKIKKDAVVHSNEKRNHIECIGFKIMTKACHSLLKKDPKMLWLVAKYAMTVAVIVLISEVAKRSDRMGGLIAALPMITILVLIWMQLEHQDPQKISNHAWYTFWYVVPTLPMFLLFPMLYVRCGFWLTLGICCLVTIVLFFLWSLVLQRFGIHLM